MTEKEKMLSGLRYDPTDKELTEIRTRAHLLSQEYNLTSEAETEKRQRLLDALLPHHGKGTYIQGPVQFDYGVFTTVGENFYANFNLTVLDICPVTIGDNVFFGPNCTIAGAMHDLDPAQRNMRRRGDGSLYDLEYGKPVTIGDNCWIASNVVICAGVTVGSNVVIGAGAVVTRDIPDNCVAGGVPARKLKDLPPASGDTKQPMTLEQAKAAIPLGRYRHYKGNEYEVLGIARHSETLEPMVVYKALYGDNEIWVRPAQMWNEPVGDGSVLRFTPIP